MLLVSSFAVAHSVPELLRSLRQYSLAVFCRFACASPDGVLLPTATAICLTGHLRLVCGDFGCRLIETNGEKDHVHLLVEPMPHTTPSKLVNSLKGVSSRFLRQEFGYAELASSVPQLEKYYWKGGLWSPSYFIASCGGASLHVIKKYIENQ